MDLEQIGGRAWTAFIWLRIGNICKVLFIYYLFKVHSTTLYTPDYKKNGTIKICVNNKLERMSNEVVLL
jgi:hypothetical protein